MASVNVKKVGIVNPNLNNVFSTVTPTQNGATKAAGQSAYGKLDGYTSGATGGKVLTSPGVSGALAAAIPTVVDGAKSVASVKSVKKTGNKTSGLTTVPKITINVPNIPYGLNDTTNQLKEDIQGAYDRMLAGRQTAYDDPYQSRLDGMVGQRYRDYETKYQPQVDGLMDRLLNRGEFNYNWSEDPLYRQYAARYQQQARQGMQDTMGQAAALTGGYGSSYAQAAGQQAYANQMAGLNDQAMQLYQAAKDRYDSEGSETRQNLSALQAMEDRNRANYEADRGDYYGRQDADMANMRASQAMNYQAYQDALNREDTDRELAWRQYQYWNNLYNKLMQDGMMVY